jgi:hypothetical protein
VPSQDYQIGVRIVRRDKNDRIENTVLRFRACNEHGSISDTKVLPVFQLGSQNRPEPGVQLIGRVPLNELA